MYFFLSPSAWVDMKMGRRRKSQNGKARDQDGRSQEKYIFKFYRLKNIGGFPTHIFFDISRIVLMKTGL